MAEAGTHSAAPDHLIALVHQHTSILRRRLHPLTTYLLQLVTVHDAPQRGSIMRHIASVACMRRAAPHHTDSQACCASSRRKSIDAMHTHTSAKAATSCPSHAAQQCFLRARHMQR